ncbi:MAG: NUDIX domain-containing protein [Sphingomonas adhaesiva]|uniref:NUDIX domain-containing protein n=1 Tax=Sphingomonas adhaesiva TaxID=28212 RepID=UPI002FFB61E0
MTLVRSILSLLYPVRRRAMALLRWKTRGVKVLLFDPDGRVLLVRHGYGRSDLFMLPGGGVARRESPAAAAVREIREELDCAITDPTPIATYRARAEGRRDTVHLFSARTADRPTPDGREIIEARFVALDALPGTTSAATRRRIAEWRGERARSADW